MHFCEQPGLPTFYWRLFSCAVSAKLGNIDDPAARKACAYVNSKCYVGDWFVLYQISKNVNMYFYRVFIKELRRDMKRTPKQKLPPYLDVNSYKKEDEGLDLDDDLDLNDLEEGSSLLGEDAHNAPTL